MSEADKEWGEYFVRASMSENMLPVKLAEHCKDLRGGLKTAYLALKDAKSKLMMHEEEHIKHNCMRPIKEILSKTPSDYEVKE